MVGLKQPKSGNPPGPANKKRSKETSPGGVDYEALFQFRYRLRKFIAFSDANAYNAGLTSQQYLALLAIKGGSDRKPLAVGQLAQSLLIKHHTAVELVDRMVKLELLQRTTDVNDNRRALVTLTRKGFLRMQKVARINFRHLGSSSLTLARIAKVFG